jgi:hypothetical protein
VASIWYDTPAKSADDANAEWRVMIARTADGVHWTVSTLTKDPIHKGSMCSSASCLGEARFAGDFLGLAIDRNGDYHAAWMHQTGSKIPPTTQVNLQKWDQVEYARTGGNATLAK